MTKIAIIYTGEVRTCESTLPYFVENVLSDENYHVFSIIQINDINKEDFFKNLFRTTIGEHLKSLDFFDKNNIDWIHLRESLLRNMSISDYWKIYLRHSGSMIEYYQMYLAFKNLEIYEKNNNFTYDYILRFRTDTILKDKITFNTKEYNEEYIKNLLYKIKSKLSCDTIISEEILLHFMNIFYNEKRINYMKFYFDNKLISDNIKNILKITDENDFIKSLKTYINDGNYIITLRTNVIYFLKRELMDKIHILGITYGSYTSENNDYWFNAESQLKQICLINNIDFYSSTSSLEGQSLYEYNYTNYFDETNNLIDNKYSFFIKRH